MKRKTEVITIDLNDFENKTWIRTIRIDPKLKFKSKVTMKKQTSKK